MVDSETPGFLAVLMLQTRFPRPVGDIGLSCIVLECTNMPPYAEAIRQATGLRVEHLPSLIKTLWKTP